MKNRILGRAAVPAALALAALMTAPATFAAGTHAGGHGEEAAIGAAANASAASRTVEVAMYDNYYEPGEITVEPGETVRFVVTNKGQLVHEFNVGTAAMHAAHQDEMMMMVQHGVLEADKINHDMMNMDMGGGHVMKHDDPNSVLLEPGQTSEVVWTFPSDASVHLQFACNVPGHYQAGMQGEIELAK